MRIFGTMFRDLSEAFDKISHELLPAKLHAYNLSDKPPNLTCGYLKDRK